MARTHNRMIRSSSNPLFAIVNARCEPIRGFPKTIAELEKMDLGDVERIVTELDLPTFGVDDSRKKLKVLSGVDIDVPL